MNAAFLTIADAGKALRARAISARELTRLHLDRIAAHDPQLDAYVCVVGVAAMEAARRADDRLARGGEAGQLTGIPFAVKDILDVEGLPTLCQSRIMPDRPASRSAPAVARLEAGGAILLGKTALHEFATGGPGFDLPFPPARNPWDPRHHPGGSSSGSGTAVAAGLAMAAIGTDTAGSVRHPATACGIVGLKPTYDLIPREGAFPLSFSLDHVGPLARSVADCAILLDAMADDRGGGSYGGLIGQGMAGLRIGVLDTFHVEGGPVDAEVEAGFATALDALRGLGATLVPVSPPPLAAFLTCLRIIQQGESYAVHRRWLAERPQDYGAMSREKLAAGALVSAADFVTAQQARRELSARYREATRGLDAVVALSSFHLPCRIDDRAQLAATYDRQARAVFNVTGDPAIAVPVGFSPQGLPLGVQLAAAPYRERELLRIAHALETALGATRHHPALFLDGEAGAQSKAIAGSA